MQDVRRMVRSQQHGLPAAGLHVRAEIVVGNADLENPFFGHDQVGRCADVHYFDVVHLGTRIGCREGGRTEGRTGQQYHGKEQDLLHGNEKDLVLVGLFEPNLSKTSIAYIKNLSTPLFYDILLLPKTFGFKRFCLNHVITLKTFNFKT